MTFKKCLIFILFEIILYKLSLQPFVIHLSFPFLLNVAVVLVEESWSYRRITEKFYVSRTLHGT